MDCEIIRGKVVREIIEWCDDWVRKEVGPGDRVFGIELSVYVDRDEGGKERGEYSGKKSKRSGLDELVEVLKDMEGRILSVEVWYQTKSRNY